jgi:hypothetical protein
MLCRSVAAFRAASAVVGVLPRPLDRLSADGFSPNLDGMVIPPRFGRQNLVCGNGASRDGEVGSKVGEAIRDASYLLLIIAFIDFEKAFENVNGNTLLDILAADNVPDQIIHAIYNIYSNNRISIKN